jgi:co-chaperonin GroES (HSP10)
MIKGTIKPIRDNVIVSDMEFDQRTTRTGIIIPNDDGKVEGVRSRWGRVWAVGPEQMDVKVGDWILVEHGRWTRGIEFENEQGEKMTVRRVDVDCILAVADEKPSEF